MQALKLNCDQQLMNAKQYTDYFDLKYENLKFIFNIYLHGTIVLIVIFVHEYCLKYVKILFAKLYTLNPSIFSDQLMYKNQLAF